jgi:DNA invertase Pin-like site-specific DNA recombinase
MKVVGYLRVSTSMQVESGASLQAQRRMIELECERKGWELVDVFEDAAASGKSMNGRPALREALEMLERDQADLLIAAKADRISRSVSDFSQLLQRYPRRLHILDLGVDLASPYGEMVAHVVAAMAQLERRLIGERTKAALRMKKEAGVRLGRPREIPADVIERVRELREEGLSASAIARRLNEDGVRSPRGGQWHPPGVARMLRWSEEAAA